VHVGLKDGEHGLVASTQTYQSADGKLLSNYDLSEDIPESDAYSLKRWHFVYLGYDSERKTVFSFVWFRNGAQHLPINNVFHYLSKKFYLYLARDGIDSPFVGRIARVRISAGPGAYEHEETDITESSVFQFALGHDSLLAEDDVADVDDPANDEWDRKLQAIVNVGFDTKPAKVKAIAGNSDGHYGYGYWLRFIGYYPKTVPTPSQDVYFVSRLTQNTEYEDSNNVGDRQLYVELNSGKFVFATYNSKPANPNISQEVKVAHPFEGRW
jgi:hypothetical protein